MSGKYKNLCYGAKFRTFQKEYLKNPLVSPSHLVEKIYDCKNTAVAYQIASQNLRKLKITLPEVMNRFELLTDIDDLKDLRRLSHAKKIQDCDIFVKGEDGKLRINKNSNDFIEVDDNQVQAKILELRLKLKGHLHTDTHIDQSQHLTVTMTEMEKSERLSRLKKMLSV